LKHKKLKKLFIFQEQASKATSADAKAEIADALEASVASIDDELVDSESRAQEITESLAEEIKDVQESRKEL
jgi:hypothetical protein